MIKAAHLPDKIQSLSELIKIESTTQTALYVTLRIIWIDF
jgi:hypothetical protein